MPQVSDRAVAMPASPIRRLAPYAEAAAARGVRILHLNIGQPDSESPPLFWEAVRNKPLKVLEYSHSAGFASLRTKLRSYYASIGIPLEEPELIVTTAGSEAIQFAMQACLNPGDEVIVPEPLYANYLGFACQGGVKVLPIATRLEEDFALPGPEAFAERITPRTKAILINNPGNPTGAVYDRRQLEALRDIALRHDLFVLADEVYRDFNYTPAPIVSVMELEGLERHAVMVDSTSKRFSLCGARVGFLISRNREVMSAGLRFAQARLSPPTLEQYGVEAAFDTPQSYFDEVREEYRARRDLLAAGINAMDGALCPRIDGAFYATVRLPVDDADRFSQWLLEEFQLGGATVMLAPASGFYATEGLGRDEARIAYVRGREVLAEAIRILRAALAVYPGRTCDQRTAVSA
jgi:aspartate aminotransferase